MTDSHSLSRSQRLNMAVDLVHSVLMRGLLRTHTTPDVRAPSRSRLLQIHISQDTFPAEPSLRCTLCDSNVFATDVTLARSLELTVSMERLRSPWRLCVETGQTDHLHLEFSLARARD